MVRALVVFSLAAFSGCTRSTPGQEADLQGLVDRLRAAADAPGAILGLRLPGEGVLVAASGVSDLESGRPLLPTDAYFLGSISKTYTAVVALRLVEEGQLALDDPLSRFLPDFPRAEEVTIRHLLEHTSGIKDFYSYLYFRPDRAEMIEFVTKEWRRAELLELAGRFGFWFEPGSDWSYSSTNYYLLGLVIENLTGGALSRAYRSLIYEPLELEGTWLTLHEPARRQLEITGHMGFVDGWDHSEMFGELGATTVLDRSPVEWGAGGLAAPADDALRFLGHLVEGDLLAPASLDLMEAFRATPALGVAEPGVPGASRPDGYGMGLVRLERPGATFWGHGGMFTGHTAGLWHIPVCGVTIALYFNRGFVGQRAALDLILETLTAVDPRTRGCTRDSVAAGEGTAGA